MIPIGEPADEMKRNRMKRILKIKLAGLNVCVCWGRGGGMKKQVRQHSELLLKLRFA